MEEVCSAALAVTESPSYKAINTLLRNRNRKPSCDGRPDGGDYVIRRFK